MATTNGHAKGTNGVNGTNSSFPPARFSHVPPTILIAVAEGEGETYDIEISLDEDIQEDPTELCTLLENEQSAKNTWMTVAVAYAKRKKVDVAIDVLKQAVEVYKNASSQDRLSILSGLCWLYLQKCREAPRMKALDGNHQDEEVQLKESYVHLATGVLNEASRINPSYPPLYLARGVLYLLRASAMAPPTTGGPNSITPERMETLKQAAKCFDDALRASNGRNLMARLGKARVNYSMGKYADALKLYQNVLESSPGLKDPDPRIGIGCCFWQLGHKDEAAGAWQRSLDLNPQSKIALILLGIYNRHLMARLPTSDPKFRAHIRKTQEFYTNALKLDKNYPLTCANFANLFLQRRDYAKTETLSRRAIELTDVNDIASDGWYQLARKEHAEDNTVKAGDFYTRSDRARGGEDRGSIPAKFGQAQLRVLMQDYDGAKFRLEKILQQQPAYEAHILLGTLYAEDVFAAQAANSKEDKSTELKKALKLLEDVTKAWKDPKKGLDPDPSVLLNLARLYEAEHPEKSLKCLEEVEKLELEAIPEEDYPEEIEDEALQKAALRELLPPQLLNNMACFHYQHERYVQARELFQTALNACVKAASRDDSIDTDALVTSISYNLGRTYESEGMHTEATDVYEGLLKRHAEYIDARIRLAYIKLRQDPQGEGPRAVKELYEQSPDNMEVRTLYGWYINKAKKRTQHFNEDQEQRHHKHTLQKIPGQKHDLYSLTGMGNIYLTIAREMKRDTEQDKDQRRKTYQKAVEFFDKVLQLDPKNAYAAQGLAIAMAEDKKDYSTALQIFSKIKDTLKDYTVFMNLGHTYCEIKQFARAIEMYEIALSKEGRSTDQAILACLGRAWLMRGKAERSLPALKSALEYSQRALDVSPDVVHFRFNVAFVQNQVAQLIMSLPEAQRSVTEVKAAVDGLEQAIETFSEIAKGPNPPFPKQDIEARANMGRNTMRKQLERALAKQQAYEDENHDKLEKARKVREEEQAKREEEKRKAIEAAAERKRKILEEQERLRERDREYLEKRAAEERVRQELIDDSELRKSERRKKGGSSKKRKQKGSEIETDTDDSDAERPRRRRHTTESGVDGSEEERPREKKKRKLERKKKEPVGKYKSADVIVDSDEEAEGDDGLPPDEEEAVATPGSNADDDAGEAVAAAPRARKGRVVDDEDEDEDEDAGEAPATGAAANGGADTAMPDEDDDEDE